MHCIHVISLLQGTRLVDNGTDQIVIEALQHLSRPRVSLNQVTPTLRQVIEQLAGEGSSIADLNVQVLQAEGTAGLAKLHHYLGRCAQFALLSYRLVLDDKVFAGIIPLSNYFHFKEDSVDKEQRYRLSRFAYQHYVDGFLVLESALGHAKIELYSPFAAAALQLLSQPHSANDLVAALDVFDTESALMFLNYLLNAQAIIVIPATGEDPEASNPALAQWDFHDLVFHTRCRLGRHANPFGGTYAFKDKFEALPVIKSESSSVAIALPIPDLEQLNLNDTAFSAVLEGRESLREQGETPISIAQLGEFLYRSARVKKMAPDAGVSWRPSPGGGAIHELEIYALIHNCSGLDSGLYHYNAKEHALYKIESPQLALDTLADMARVTAAMKERSQIVFIIAARFQRMQIKYQSMTYAAILKNVGCLYQTMYLVATAMKLAPCALGGGHADLFAQAAGLNYYAETSVGEFVLGSRSESK